MSQLRYYGHACFSWENQGNILLFDPFLKDNPFQIAQPEDIDCHYILVSHGHFDHLGDAVAIAKRTGATIISTAEIANLCAGQECKTHAMHLGGTFDFPFGSVRVTPAFHGAGIPGGHACGFIVRQGEHRVYFAGDTALFGDMTLLGRLESIDCALLPIGGNFTMGPKDAAEAVAMLKPAMVVPMHYNTWPVIEQDPAQFKQDVESRLSTPVRILKPGETLTF